MKSQQDQHCSEQEFELGNWVFLILQPYKQKSLKDKGVEELRPRYYKVYKVLARMEQIAYTLELTTRSWVHNTFHVSILKKTLRQKVKISNSLPPLNKEGCVISIPSHILATWEKKLRTNILSKYPIQWKVLPLEDATWKDPKILQHPTLQLLWGKAIQGGGTVTMVKDNQLQHYLLVIHGCIWTDCVWVIGIFNNILLVNRDLYQLVYFSVS